MIDLHIHTTYSDGLNSLTEVLNKAQKLNLNIISITDHDTALAYNELENIEYQKIYKGRIMKGIEISSKYHGHKIELLAYNFDDYNVINKVIKKDSYRNNKEMYKTIEKERLKLIRKFIELNIKVDPYYINNLFIKAFESNLYNSILKDNNKEILKEKLQDNYQEKGYDFYRKCVTSPNTPFYIDYSKLNKNIDEICDIIHKQDGLVFLAHPYLYGMKNTIEELNKMYKEYPKLDGLECYYNGFNNEEIENIKKFANNNKLLISGGSDFHGKPGYKNQLGYCCHGEKYIENKIIDNWNIEIKPLVKKRFF